MQDIQIRRCKNSLDNYNSLLDIQFEDIRQGDYIWVGTDGQSWNIYKYTNTANQLRNPSGDEESHLIYLTAVDVHVGDIIGIDIDPAEGFYTVQSVVGDNITVSHEEAVDDVTTQKVTLLDSLK